MAKQHVRVELFYQHTESGVTKFAWHRQADPDDPTASAAYTRDPIGISHGRGPEQGEPTPSSAALTFKGHTHNPEDPAGDLYGLIGLNTPIRVISGDQPVLNDPFDRTSVDSWSGAGALSWLLVGGTVPGDYDVSGGAGIHTHPSANQIHASHVDTGSPDHVVRALWDLSADDITGGSAVVTVRGRVTDGSNYYALNAEYSTGEQVTISLVKRVAGVGAVLAAYGTAINLSGIAGSDLYGELVVEDNRLYGKVWRRFGGVDEPIAYQVTAEDDDLTTGTLAGWGSLRATGNTNASLQARLYDFTAMPGTIRFAGEVADWMPRRAPGGDRWVEVEAGGPLRRLQSPQADVLRSALWREILFGNPLAFWPVNDGPDSAYASSGLPGGAPMSVVTRDWTTAVVQPLDWDLASYGDWLEPIATPATGLVLHATGPVTMDPAATSWAGDFVFVIEPDADATAGALCFFRGVGGLDRTEWILIFQSGQWALIRRPIAGGFPTGDTTVAGGAVAYKDGNLKHARLTMTKNGANVDFEARLNNSVLGSGTTAGWTTLAEAETQTGTPTGRSAIGFVVVWGSSAPPANAANAAVVGRSGELVGDRLARLFAEEGIAFELVGSALDTEAAGPQLIDTLAANASACEAVDMGLLHDTRHQVGCTYRTRVSLYNQVPVTLDVEAGGEVAPPLEPSIGDLGVVNDVTVKRVNGASARSVAESGPLNVNPPHVDRQGVGRYAVDVTVNADRDAQLQGLADWRRQRGTVKAVRYPKVTVKYGALAADGKATLAAAVDRLRIGDRVDLAAAEPTGVMQLVPGYAETVGATVAERSVTISGTPANVYDVGVYNVDARYDSAYSTTAASFVAGTDTALSVAVESGRALWVAPTSANAMASFPFDINVAGARLTVRTVGQILNSNPFFESDVALWGANGGATIAHSTAQAHEGTGSMLITPDGVTATTGAEQSQAGAAVTTPGADYLIVGWLRAVGALADVRMAVNWYQADETTFVSSSLPAPIALSAGVWTAYAAVVTAPALGARARLRVRLGSTPTAAVYADECMLIPVSSYSASPQTFTVAQAVVNGITKTIPAGAQVRLWSPRRYGL